VAVLLSGAAFWEFHHPLADQLGASGLPYRLASAGTAIGLALLVLARAERNRALLLIAVGYLVVVLVPVDFGWTMDPLSPWYFVPRLVIDGGVLLLSGIGFALAQQPLRPPAA